MASDAFLDDVLAWLHDEETTEYSWPNSTQTRWMGGISHKPVRVVNVVAWGSDYADGGTEEGYTGDTTVDITWVDSEGHEFMTEVRPGDQMASLWEFMIKRWRDHARG